MNIKNPTELKNLAASCGECARYCGSNPLLGSTWAIQNGVWLRSRMHLELLTCRDVQESIETTMSYRFENKDLEKPVCVAEQINRWFLI